MFRRAFSRISASAGKMAAIIGTAFAVKQVAAFGAQCLELGSDLAEVQNVVDVTFPTMAAEIDNFAQSAAAAYGLSETMAKQYAGTFGSMAEAFGFTEAQAADMAKTLTGLTGDVASFYNLSQDEAYTKLKSVFSGETETLKDLGVIMTQSTLDAYALANGWGKTTSEMTEAEKVSLRMAFVQGQLTNAAGDFARTSDSWANQTRILKLQMDSLKASIGQGLINVLTPAIKTVNALIGRIATLASTFKAFTEQLMGNHNSDTSNAAQDTANAVENIADATQDAADATKAADKANKTYLSGLDEIAKYTSDDSSSNSTNVPTTGGASVDTSGITQQQTVLDRMLDTVKQLQALFKSGFEVGFGDSAKRIDEIKRHLKSIGQTAREIFSDPAVQASLSQYCDSIIYNLGVVAGSMASIGVSIATNLIGGFDIYLQGSKEFIKNRLVEIFDAGTAINNLIGGLSAALADIATVIAGENGQMVTAALIGIFSDATLSIASLLLQFGADVINLIATPIIDNTDGIKTALDGLLGVFATVFDGIQGIIKDLSDGLASLYKKHISPFFSSLANGISEILGTLLDGFNTYFVPVIQGTADKLRDFMRGDGGNAIRDVIKLLGSIIDLLKTLWERILQPLLNWIASKIFPILSPIIGLIGTNMVNALGVAAKAIGIVSSVLSTVIDWVTKAIKKFADLADTISQSFAGQFIKSAANVLIRILNAIISGVANVYSNVTKILNNLSFKLPDWAGGYTIGFHFPTSITAPQIPYLATGAVIPPNKEFLAVLGDQKSGNNIEAPESLLRQIVAEESGGRGGQYRFTAQINRRTLFDEVIEEAKLRAQLTGMNPFEFV